MNKIGLTELMDVAPELAFEAPEVLAVIMTAFTIAEIIDMLAEGISPGDLVTKAMQRTKFEFNAPLSHFTDAADAINPPQTPIRVNAPRPAPPTGRINQQPHLTPPEYQAPPPVWLGANAGANLANVANVANVANAIADARPLEQKENAEPPARLRLKPSSQNHDKKLYRYKGQIPKGNINKLLEVISSSEGGRILDIASKYRVSGKIPMLSKMAKSNSNWLTLTTFLADHNIYIDETTVGSSGGGTRNRIRNQILAALASKNSAEAADFVNRLADLLTRHYDAPADFVNRRNVAEMTFEGEPQNETDVALETPELEPALRDAFKIARIPPTIGNTWIRELVTEAQLLSAGEFFRSGGNPGDYNEGRKRALRVMLDAIRTKLQLLARRQQIQINIPSIIQYLRSAIPASITAFRGVDVRTLPESIEMVVANPPIIRAANLLNVDLNDFVEVDLEDAVAPIRANQMADAEAALIRSMMGSRVYGTPLFESPFLDIIRNDHNPADGPAPDPDPNPYRTIISVRYGQERGVNARWFSMNIKSLAIFLGIVSVSVEAIGSIARALLEGKVAKGENRKFETTPKSIPEAPFTTVMPTRSNKYRDFRKDFPELYPSLPNEGSKGAEGTSDSNSDSNKSTTTASDKTINNGRRKLLGDTYTPGGELHAMNRLSADSIKSSTSTTEASNNLGSIRPRVMDVIPLAKDTPGASAGTVTPLKEISMKPINPTVNAFLPNSVFDYKTLNGYYDAIRDINVKLQVRGLSKADLLLLNQQKAKYVNAINTIYPSGGALNVSSVDARMPIPIVPKLPAYGVKPIVDPKTLEYHSFEASKIYPDAKLEAIMRANGSIGDIYKYNAMVDDLADRMVKGQYDNASSTTGAGSYKAAYSALEAMAEKIRSGSSRGGAYTDPLTVVGDAFAVDPSVIARVAADKNTNDQASVAFTTAQRNYNIDYKRLMDAIASGDQSVIGDLHAQLAVDKQNVVDAKRALDAAVTQVGYGDALSSNLRDQTLEHFPVGTSESAIFNRIQQLERGIAENDDMLKQYNEELPTLDKHSPTYFVDREFMLTSIYAQSNQPKPTITEMAIPELGVLEGDDLDSRVDFNKDIDVRDNEGEGMARADVVDPAEVRLFLNSGPAAKEQQKMFTEFSKIAPGHGLGSMQFNTLRQANAKMEAKQYAHTLQSAPRFNPTLGRRYQSPYITTTVAAQELLQRQTKPQNQPMMIPTVQGEFGKIAWEVDGARGNGLMGNHFTNERLHTNRWSEWDNPYNIEQPELSLDRYQYRGVPIQQPRMNGYDYGVPQAQPSTQGNILLSNRLNGYNFTPLMRDDDFDKKGKPVVVKSNIDTYNQRIGSSRMK